MTELVQLKSVLRSLVVSSPACVDARALLRDYRSMMGEALPAARFGYRDPVQFLRERCADCFLFSGPSQNPMLTPIVPESLKHIDEFVQKQRTTSKGIRFMGKRRSVPEPRRPQPPRQNNLVAQTFRPAVNKPPLCNNTMDLPKLEAKKPETETQFKKPEVAPQINGSASRLEVVPVRQPELQVQAKKPDVVLQSDGREVAGAEGGGEGGDEGRSRLILQRLRARARGSCESLPDDDSGRHTASSGSGKRAALERLGADVAALLAAQPQGEWASRLPRLYEERFGRELNYSRLGFASIAALACALPGVAATRAPDGDWLLRDASAPRPAPCPAPAPRVRRASAARSAASLRAADPEDALPGIDYDPDVFPADCLSFAESIPAADVSGLRPGDMLPLLVGEVYSPSHLWVLLLGPGYDQMEAFMDEMTEYYTRGSGASRVLAAGARRPGQYCSSVFEGDWHRSLIVQPVDSDDNVKVLHVDYGTVDCVPAAMLRPLRRAWGALPAQAVRARLAGLRPPAGSRRWPRAAAAHCLRLVRDTRLVGNLVAVDYEENILELLLIDTSTAVDRNITDEMISAGHADPRPRPALGAAESYLFPLFAALEAGATPNYAEIHALLRDGIALDYVEAYRRHVPALLPTPPPASPEPPPSPPPTPPAPAPPALTRVPLLWASQDLPAVAAEPEPRAALPALPEAAEPAPAAPPATPPPARASTPLPAAEAAPEPAPEPVPEAPAPAAEPAPAPAPTTPAPPVYTPRPLPPPAPRAPHPPAFYAVPPQPCYGAFFRQLPQPYAPGSPFLLPPHPAQFYPPPPRYPPAPQPQYPPLLQWSAQPPPAPPAAAPPEREVRLTAAECEIFELLSRVDKNAAHGYMTEQLRRARGTPAPSPAAPAAALNPLAAEFRIATAPQPAPRPPPGFENHRPFAQRF